MKGNKKDKRIEKLFDECAEGHPMPDRRVIFKAEDELAEKSVPDEVFGEVPVAAGATCGNTVSSGGVGRLFGRIPIFAWYIAFVLIIAAVVLATLLPIALRSNNNSVDKLSESPYITRSQLLESNAQLDEEMAEIIPFIGEEALERFTQFALASPAMGYDDGDVVMWRAEYTAYEGVDACLYVEARNIFYDKLSEYKNIQSTYTSGRITFRFHISAREKATRIYFLKGGYGYNIEAETVDLIEVDAIIENIAASF